jgi:phosphoglycolate phosphatase
LIRLYVFDLDGTLVDSRRDLADSANALLAECGAAALPEDRIGDMVGEGAAVLVARVFAAAGVPIPSDALQRYLAHYDRRLLNHTRPYAGMIETLDAISARAPMAVLTNKPLAATRRILDGLGLARFFGEAVIGGDGPLPRKPEPAGLQHLASAAGVAIGSTLMVGDSVIDWETARRAASRMCLARYGFGFHGFSAGQIRAEDRVVDTPAGILDL